MDVHRARFVPYPTSAINCLAFSRSNDSGHEILPSLKLAIGRTSGCVEIWNPNHGNWFQEAVFPGDGRSLDGLVWTQDADENDADGRLILGQLRLFSIASSPTVTEWDLGTGRVKRKSTGNFSEVWCFAAQPRLSTQKNLKEADARSQEIVAGCGDGTIVVLSTEDNDLQFKRFLARVNGKKARCMCITYQNRDIVVAGFADSMIRVYDTRNGQQIRTMSLGTGLPGAPKNALVWQVKCLPSGDIVSGDSNGEVRIWDRRTFSSAQRIRGHSTDCLDLVVSTDGSTIFSGSIDGKIAVYKQSQTQGARRHWARISGRAIHHGEVKAMAAFDSKSFSVVVLGGSGVAPMTFPLRDYGKAYPRSLSNLPHQSPIVSAPRARLLISWWNEEISIWRIRKTAKLTLSSHTHQPKKLVASMALSGKEIIQCVAVTTDGSLLAASTDTKIKLFSIQKKSGVESIAIEKINLPADFAALGARILRFAPNGKWLAAVTPDSEVHIARILAREESVDKPSVARMTVELDRRHRQSTPQSGFKSYDRCITQLSFSYDSAIIAVADRSGHIDTWLLHGDEDSSLPPAEKLNTKVPNSSSDDGSDASSSDDDDDDDETVAFYGQHWTDNSAGHLIPKLKSPPMVFAFRPPPRHNTATGKPKPSDRSHDLFVITAKHDLHEFDVVKGGLTPWSAANSSSVLLQEIAGVKDRAMGAVWDVKADREQIWIYGTSWIFMLNLAINHVVTSRDEDGALKNRKRKSVQNGETRLDRSVLKRIRMGSAAWGQMRAQEREGFGAKGRLHENGESTEIGLDGETDEGVHDTDDEALDDYVDMIEAQGAIEETQSTSLEKTTQGDDEDQRVVKHKARQSWLSFEYRPILGMVGLLGSDEDTTGGDALEVVIVERPVWEPTDR